jgi:hypothetical protein
MKNQRPLTLISREAARWSPLASKKDDLFSPSQLAVARNFTAGLFQCQTEVTSFSEFQQD